MSGTKAGGLKAKETNLKLHGEDFYKKIGARGGRNGHTGGFASNPELARRAGAKGGRKSRRGMAKANVLNNDAEKIMRLVKDGASYVDIAKLYKVPYHVVTYWMRKKNNA
jgi:general stress protein YciG